MRIPERARSFTSGILDVPRRVFSAYQECMRPEREYRRANRFISSQFERLLREEITYGDVYRNIRSEAENPSILKLDPKMLFYCFNGRRIAFELFGK